MREVWKVTELSVYPEYSGGYKTVVAAKTVPKGVNSLCLSFKKKKKCSLDFPLEIMNTNKHKSLNEKSINPHITHS